MAQKRVYLIRHARTAGNEKKRYVGNRTDEALSETGIREARACRTYYRDLLGSEREEGLRFCASPLKRALQTADILFDHPRITSIPELTEIDFGDFEGKDYRELSDCPLYLKWIESNGRLPFPGGESRAAFVNRSVRGFREALGDPGIDETVVILCHGGTVMALLSDLTGGDYYDFMIDSLEGYKLVLEMRHEGIPDLSYRRIGPGHPA